MTPAPQFLIPNAQSLITAALAEDIGTGDITSELLISEDAQAEMQFVAREPLVVCGGFIPEMVFLSCGALSASTGSNGKIDPAHQLRFSQDKQDGQLAKSGDVIAIAKGSARTLLTGERVALNLMQRMSGVATLTHQYVDAVKGTKAVILDTRKTMPGMRQIDKYAVRMGGGSNHRMGLWDMVLVKDNHLGMRVQSSEFRVQDLVGEVRKKLTFRTPNSELRTLPIVVECDTLAQVEEALAAKPDRILLDNMDLEMMRKAVAMSNGKVPLEASGGVSLSKVRAIAETGVDYISVGKLTHSAPAVDIAADIKILT